MSFWENILYGALASVLATIVWVLGNKLFSLTARSDNTVLLNEAEDIAREIYHNLSHNKYDLAIICCFELRKILQKLRMSMLRFNYFKPDERKLFFTYIYQIEGILNVARNLSVGKNDIKEEETARCKSLLGKYFTGKEVKTIEVLLAVLNQCNSTKNYTKAFENPYQLSDITKDDIYNLVDVNCFKIENNETDILRKKCFTRKEYETFLDKYFPKKGANKCKN